WVCLKCVYDRRRIDKQESAMGKRGEVYRLHPSRNLRISRALAPPHRPRPDPAAAVIGSWRLPAAKADSATIAATGRPCFVMTVERPFSASWRSCGSLLRVSSTPFSRICDIRDLCQTVQLCTVQVNDVLPA